MHKEKYEHHNWTAICIGNYNIVMITLKKLAEVHQSSDREKRNFPHSEILLLNTIVNKRDHKNN